MYRNWHERLAQGEAQIQGVIPLTPDRIPFHVRYITEFDKDGKPIKAYGSATLAVDNEKESQLREIISSLTMKYATVLKVDLDSGETEVLNVGHDSSVQVQNLYYENKTFSFEDIREDYLENYVFDADVPKMKELFSLDSIKNILANAALSLIQGFPLDLPLFYDPEFIRGRACRVDNLTKEQFTANTVAFCSTVAAAGYQPGIYSNLVFEGFHLDMPTIQNYSVWYADYASIPQTPYDFQYLQISETGQVPGITGNVDVDLMFIPTTQQ